MAKTNKVSKAKKENIKGKKIELRPYQKECVNVVNSLPDGSRSIVALATGLGKTVTAANFKTKGRILWISHRDELVRQPEKYFKAIGKTYGIEKAQETSKGEDVVSASIQSISTDSRLKKFKPDEFDLIICDEAHHAAAATYRKTLSYFKPRKLIGLTATPKRGDGKRLTDCFDDICFQRNLLWGIEEKYLSPIRCLKANASFDMKKLKHSMGDITASSLENEMDSSDDDLVVTKMYLEHCFKQKKQTLVYCPTIAICKKVCMTLKKAVGDKKAKTIAFIDSKTPDDLRHKIVKDFNDKKINCICNCMVLTEGADFPNVECIINNRPTTNASLYEQMIGRGTRLYEGKEYCLVIDIVGKNNYDKQICTAPTLFGIDPDILPKETRQRLYKDEDLHEIMKNILTFSKEKLESLIIHQEMVDVFTQKRVAILDENMTGLKDIAKAYNDEISQEITEYDFGDILVRRTPADEHFFEIPATYNGHIWFSKPDMLDKTVMDVDIPDIALEGFGPLDFVTDSLSMEDAVSLAGSILKYALPYSYRIRWSRSERERMSHDKASEKQQNYIKKLYKKFPAKDDLKDLNKLEASDLIELSKEIESLKEERREIESDIIQLKGKGKKSDTRISLEKLEIEDNEKKARGRERAKAIFRQRKFSAFMDMFKDIRHRKQIEEKTISDSVGRDMCFRLDMQDSDLYRLRYRPTEKQVDYVISLINSLKKRHGELFNSEIDAEELDGWRINLTIRYLQTLKDIPVPNNAVLITNSRKFFNDLDYIIRTRKLPDFIECVFRIIEKEKGEQA